MNEWIAGIGIVLILVAVGRVVWRAGYYAGQAEAYDRELPY